MKTLIGLFVLIGFAGCATERLYMKNCQHQGSEIYLCEKLKD